MAVFALPLVSIAMASPFLMELALHDIFERASTEGKLRFFSVFLAPVILARPFIIGGMIYTFVRIGKHLEHAWHSHTLPVVSKTYVRIAFVGMVLVSFEITLFFMPLFTDRVLLPTDWLTTLSFLTCAATWAIPLATPGCPANVEDLKWRDLSILISSLALTLVALYMSDYTTIYPIRAGAASIVSIAFNYFAMHWMYRRN
ncbi:MAG: hypothetical protein GHCLOJNM_04550 [bacterium]|nr:hypothetical protein [bacterium]